MAHGRLTGLAPPANLLSLNGWRHIIPVDAAEWRGQRSAYAASPGEAKPGASARGAVAGSDSRVLLGTRSFCRSPTVAARPSPQESGAFEAGVVPSLGGQPSRNRPLPMFLGDVLVPLAKCPVGPSSVAGAGGTSAQGPPTALAAQPRVTSAARICGAPPPEPPEAFSLLHVTSPPGAWRMDVECPSPAGVAPVGWPPPAPHPPGVGRPGAIPLGTSQHSPR